MDQLGNAEAQPLRQQPEQEGSTMSRASDQECSRELKKVLLKQELLKRKPGNKRLDQRAIRGVLESIESQKWASVLEDLMKDGSFFVREESFKTLDAKQDLVWLLGDIFFGCVEEDLDEHLKCTIKWLDKLKRVHSVFKNQGKEDDTQELESYLNDNFYDNNEAMVRACKKEDRSTVYLLYEAGGGLSSVDIGTWDSHHVCLFYEIDTHPHLCGT